MINAVSVAAGFLVLTAASFVPVRLMGILVASAMLGLLLSAVAYANSAKSRMLGVNSEVIRAHGAVSAEVAAEMAEGARRLSGASLAVSITGIAGPGGGSEDKPIGTVWFGIAVDGEPTVTPHRQFPGDRDQIRTLAAYTALRLAMRAALGQVSD